MTMLIVVAALVVGVGLVAMLILVDRSTSQRRPLPRPPKHTRRHDD